MKSLALVLLAAALVAGSLAQSSIDECLQKDSISCVQTALFRKAKEFFDKENYELLSGVSLVKSKAEGRGSRSSKDLLYEQEMAQATGVAERQSALENFVGEEVSDFFSGRSLRVSSVRIL